MQYKIGDFSKISRLSVKTLRFYHECGILIPARVEKDSGYRYYDETCLEKTALIHELKDLDFSLSEIRQILDNISDDTDIDLMMRRKYDEITRKIKEYKAVRHKLWQYIKQTEEVDLENNNEITVKDIQNMLITSIRYRGRYNQMGDVIKVFI